MIRVLIIVRNTPSISKSAGLRNHRCWRPWKFYQLWFLCEFSPSLHQLVCVWPCDWAFVLGAASRPHLSPSEHPNRGLDGRRQLGSCWGRRSTVHRRRNYGGSQINQSGSETTTMIRRPFPVRSSSTMDPSGSPCPP